MAPLKNKPSLAGRLGFMYVDEVMIALNIPHSDKTIRLLEGGFTYRSCSDLMIIHLPISLSITASYHRMAFSKSRIRCLFPTLSLFLVLSMPFKIIEDKPLIRPR